MPRKTNKKQSEHASLLNESIGWLGVFCIVFAYALNTFGVIGVEDTAYNTINLIGAASIIWSSYKHKDIQPVVLNAIWLCIALVGLVRGIM